MGKRRRKWKLLVALILALAVWAFLGLRSRLWPVVRSLARTQVTNTASDLINDAILEQIMEGQIQYDRIVYFEKDLNGRITALKTNMAEVNRLKTETLNIINDEILAEDSEHLGVSLGSLILPEFFSGKGPSIPVRIMAIRQEESVYCKSFFNCKIRVSMLRMIFLNSSSDFPVGSSSPQLSSNPLPIKGQPTLQPMETATSGLGISEISFEYWVFSISIP